MTSSSRPAGSSGAGGLPGTRRRSAQRAEARELARLPGVDPYRGQLADPFYDRAVPADVALFVPRGMQQVRMARPAVVPLLAPPMQRKAPGLAVFAGVLSLAIGALVGIFGLMLLALINYEHTLGAPDRSFYRGSDASYVTLALLNLGVCALLVIGAIRMMMGNVAGRVSMTIGAWATIGFSTFWWQDAHAPTLLPVAVAIAGAVILMAVYHRPVSRWLGIQLPPQPE
ncbi:MAG: hypothetical protein JWN95_3873 [Frankiales bacterium]|nr:hypothetical protein [Frankiales bacterium]